VSELLTFSHVFFLLTYLLFHVVSCVYCVHGLNVLLLVFSSGLGVCGVCLFVCVCL